MEKTIRELAAEVHQTAMEKGWWPEESGGRNIGEALMLIVTEVADAMTQYKDYPERSWNFTGIGDDGKPYGLATEMADAIIRILDFCEGFGIDISEALEIKAAYNKGRPYRHRNRRA